MMYVYVLLYYAFTLTGILSLIIEYIFNND